MFARELGGPLHCVHYLKFQSKPHAPFKYILQAVKTFRILVRERPAAVHVQNPPLFCGLVVHWYCLLFGARFVIEHHSAAFGDAWRHLLPLTKFIVRRAKVNIVTSDHWADLIESWGGNALVMHDPFLDLPQGKPYPMEDGFNVAFLSTFAPDEPVDEVLEAAARLPDVNVYITGADHKRLEGGYRDATENVTFTGFLDSNGEYLGLLRGADAAMVLTTRDHTLQLAGCEAFAVGTPLITSDYPYLRGLFPGGTVFVPNTADGIEAGIEAMVQERFRLRAEVPEARRLGQVEWQKRLAALNRMVWPSERDVERSTEPAGLGEQKGGLS
ncbi:MAG: glycosyltransferase family 4 protein [Acidimicrobiia bacterium]|nr:glycosyltransferase family 4 protein [Acidimicrobiia bacterium]